MAADWRVVKLGDVVSFVSGGTPSKERADYWVGTIPWLSAKDMKRFRVDDTEDHISQLAIGGAVKIVPAGTVLLLTRGMTLLNDVPICVATRELTFNQDVKAVRPNADVRSDFLPYLLLGHKHRLLSLVDLAGHGTGRLNSDELKALALPLPPLGSQHAIAEIMSAMDHKIDVTRRMSETLEAMAQALFKSWFVDFDPVHTKLEGRDTRLSKSLAALFPTRFVDAELGRLPEGWATASIGDHFDAVKGVSYKGAGLSDFGVPLHNLNSVYEGGGYKYEGIKFYTGEFAERHVVLPGDLIVANTEQGHDRLLIGFAAIVPKLFGATGIASHHIYRVRPKPTSTLSCHFLCSLLNSPVMHDTVSGYANGTTVNMLPIDALQKPRIVCPPRELVAAFTELASGIEERREQLLVESRTLAALRDALLPKLISGELRVKDAERDVAGSV